MIKIGDKVKVHSGRNSGQIGTVAFCSENEVYVDFKKKLIINEGFGSMGYSDDIYCVKKEHIEQIK